MKKLLLATIVVMSAKWCFADALWDQIDAAFVGHAKTAVGYNSHAQRELQFLVNPIEIGNFNGGRVVAIDFGTIGILDDQDVVHGANWQVGGKIHLAPTLRKYVQLQPEWQFLHRVEIDGRYAYDLRLHKPDLTLSFGYPF